MKKIELLHGSPEEVGSQLQKNMERLMESTRRWAQILAYDPQPQTGMTPKDIVWRKNKARLYRYIAPEGIQYQTPILFIYALINKPYILDLIPGMSLIEHMVNQGFDVYLLDWGEFQWEDRHLSFTDLVYDYIARAVAKVVQISGCDQVSLAGYCMGGTITTIYAALFDTPKIRNILYLAAPIDFEDLGLSSIWLKAPEFDPDKVADTFQLVPKHFIDTGVKMLRPVRNFWGTYTRLWKSIDEGTPIEAWKALNKWVNDNVNFPGNAYRQWIKDFYQENKLMKGQLRIKGQVVDMNSITASLLVLAGEKDHLVLPHQTEGIIKHSSSQDKTFEVFPVGHGGLVFGNYAKNNVYPVISQWLAQRS